MKRIATIILALCLCACGSPVADQGGEKIILTNEEDTKISTNVCKIALSDDDAQIDGIGARLENGELIIYESGEYTLSGKFKGSVTVDITKNHKATLILSDLSVKSDTSAINIVSADKINIVLRGNNTLSDGETYADEDSAEPSACLFSADDIEISGDGKLTVKANCKNGIESKNDIKISGGSITITAKRNAVKGKDSVQISSGELTVTAAYDGIKSDNEKEDGRGNVIITGGKITLNCRDDGIQAYRKVEISAGDVSITAGDNKINCDGTISAPENCIK